MGRIIPYIMENKKKMFETTNQTNNEWQQEAYAWLWFGVGPVLPGHAISMARSQWRVAPFFVMSGDQSWGQRKPKTKQLPPSDLLSYPAILTFEGPWGENTFGNDQNWMKWSTLLLAS